MNNGQCEGNTDFLVIIPPGGCSPAVVRSDLLEEQNVPVFCQLESIKVNPLIKVSSIKSISFKGKYPSEIAGVSFYPARAALKSYTTLLGSPIANNIGYVVIILKKQNNESSMAKNISGNLTATMYYDAEKAFGVGASEFYLQTMNDEKWATDWTQQTFWGGRGAMRLVDIQKDEATVEVLTNNQDVVRSVKLKVGETSRVFYFPGFYCQAGMRLKLNSVVSPEESVLLSVDGTTMDARVGTKFINGKCQVQSLNVLAGETGSVKINCDGKSFDLSLLNAYKANLTIGSKTSVANLGEMVSSGTENVYLAYTGYTKKAIDSIELDTQFVVLIKSKTIPDKTVYSGFASRIENTFNGAIANLEGFKNSIGIGMYSSDNLVVLFAGKDAQKFNGLDVKLNGFVDKNNNAISGASGSSETQQLASDYFDRGSDAVEKLLEQYPTTSDESGVFGEQAILEEIELIKAMEGQVDYSAKKIELMNKFLELYPDSSHAISIRYDLSLAQRTDSTNAYKTVYVNNDYHSIGAVQFKPADSLGKTAEVLVDGKIATNDDTGGQLWKVGNKINLYKIAGNNKRDYLLIKDILVDGIVVDFFTTKYNKEEAVGSEVAEKDIKILFGEDSAGSIRYRDFVPRLSNGASGPTYRVALNDLTVDKIAYVSLVSELKTNSEANFTFNIGVEKRAIELSPEKATTKADELNKTIQKWEEKNAKIGDLVEKWKGVCLVTGLALQIKNFVSGLSGESFARQNVMAVYRSKCSSSDINPQTKEPYNKASVDVCYNSLSDQIANDVEAYAKAVESVNNKIDDYGGDLNKFKAGTDCSINIDGTFVSSKDINSWADARQCLLNQEIQISEATPDLKKDVKTRTEGQLRSAAESVVSQRQITDITDELPPVLKDTYVTFSETNTGTFGSSNFIISSFKEKNVADLRSILDKDESDGAFEASLGADKIGIVTTKSSSKWYIIVIKRAGEGGGYTKDGMYPFSVSSDKRINIDPQVQSVPKDQGVSVAVNVLSNKKCSYKYTNPTVRYYDSEPNKGMPAIVPVDLKEGWYVYVPQTQGGVLSSGVQGYQSSGAVQFYYLCSVGSNGREDMRGGDDICQSFNINNYNNVDAFSGCDMSKTKVQSLAKTAEDAIRQAASQYKNGVRKVNIQGVGSDINVEAGMSGDANLYQCQDFMSPEDCKIMYNVCDPVICPPSRCNFGGKMPVSNVIQSGIVGSLVLCSKNFVLFGGDVLVPVCLTGIHAGIEGYVSILKAQQTCLNEYAKTGKHVGICDEMTAVYKCEFFWRQVSPLIQNIIPNLFEFAYTGGFNKQSGGGEYATFQASWNNMQKSIDYFKNTYASTSFTAFKFGDVQQMGSSFCQNFIGTSLPTSGKALDAMLKPESPPQFYGKFSEIPLTDATVPATSQYKVYYHIYSGTDQGVRYTVYLKNPPATSYYQTAQTVVVKQGYIASGEQADEAIDFSAPKGYKELCIVINNQEECGFQSVSTEFTINALHDIYAKEQGAETDITTEKECIQGSPSILAMANTNIEAGANEAINPDISLRGVNRVCATNNPGQGTNSANWKKVGNCGNVNLACWLDLSSVNQDAMNVLNKVGTIANTQEALDENNPEARLYADEKSSMEQLTRLNSEIVVLKDNLRTVDRTQTSSINAQIDKHLSSILNSVETVIDSAHEEAHRAKAFLLKYRIYEAVTRAVLGISDSRTSGATVSAPDAGLVSVAPSGVAKTGKISTVTIVSNLGANDAEPKTLQDGVSENVFYDSDLTLVVEDSSCERIGVTKDREVIFGIPWFGKNVKVSNMGYEIGRMTQGERAIYRVNCIIGAKTTDAFVVNLNAVDKFVPELESAE
jgi:hypothetical protein